MDFATEDQVEQFSEDVPKFQHMLARSGIELVKEEMFERNDIPKAPWFIIHGNDKKRTRLKCIDHLLKQALESIDGKKRVRIQHRDGRDRQWADVRIGQDEPLHVR